MSRSRWLPALLCLVLLPVTSAGAQENRQCSPDDVKVRFRLSADEYAQDERVRMRLIAENTSDAACEMQFPSGRGGTVRIFEDGELAWEHGFCRVYTDHIEIETWVPGHRETYRFGWKQQRNAMNENGIDCEGERTAADPGRYSAKGIFFGTDPDTKTAKVAFRISG